MKKLFIINSDVYVRHYLRTDALKSIEDEDLYFLATDDVTLQDDLKARKNFLGFFHYDPEVFEQHLFLSQVMMMRYQDRSPTFGWRTRRNLDHLLIPLSEEKLLRTKTYQKTHKATRWLLGDKMARGISFQISRTIKFLRMPPENRRKLSIFTLGRPGLAPLAAKFFERTVQPNRELEEILTREKPDLVLFPSHAIDPLGNDLARLQKKLNYKTFYLIDNWDNLSSKSVFVYKPDFLGVWGEQSREHARDIHGIPKEHVFLLGTPRVEEYYETLEKILSGQNKPQSPFPYRYILYVGCLIPFDELTSLRLLDPVLDDINAGSDNPVKLVYRPHPWRNKRQCADDFNEAEFKHIVLDEQLRDYYYSGEGYHRKKKGMFQPSLDYYPRLLSNAEMVTGPLTTMLVESALLRKKVLAVAYDDGIHVTSPHNALRYYRHFEGLTDVPGMAFAHEKSNYGPLFQQVFNTPDTAIDWDAQARQIGYYLFHDERKYHQRLHDSVNAIMSGQSSIANCRPEKQLQPVS